MRRVNTSGHIGCHSTVTGLTRLINDVKFSMMEYLFKFKEFVTY